VYAKTRTRAFFGSQPKNQPTKTLRHQDPVGFSLPLGPQVRRKVSKMPWPDSLVLLGNRLMHKWQLCLNAGDLSLSSQRVLPEEVRSEQDQPSTPLKPKREKQICVLEL
jgi:hypothetical protein